MYALYPYATMQVQGLSRIMEFLSAIMSKYTHAHDAAQGKHKVKKHGAWELAGHQYNACFEQKQAIKSFF